MFRRISLVILAATCFIVGRTEAQSKADLAFWQKTLADKIDNRTGAGSP
jgi:hypothetical protein